MINVVGLGYIGLPTALMFAKNGLEVVGTDYNSELIDSLNNGIITFDENGLNELFDDAVSNGIIFTTEYKKTDTYIISVPTPYIKQSKKLDPKYIISALNSVLDVCVKGAMIIIESTISPGSIDKYIRPEIIKRGFATGTDIHIVHAPERIIPGNMIYELECNPRVIGADNKVIGERIKALYSSFCKANVVVTDINTAEMSKVVENTYRDINIAFANELAKICRSADLDVYEIIRIANMHPRVNILQPGPGVGGHCISVDPWFLVGDYPGLSNIILAARKINDSMPEFVLNRIYNIMKENGMNDVNMVGLYGLTYKENVDDIRESPSLQLIGCMKKHLAGDIKSYDPFVKGDVVENQYHDLDSFLSDVSLVVIMIGHMEIEEQGYKLKGKIVLDTRNIQSVTNIPNLSRYYL